MKHTIIHEYSKKQFKQELSSELDWSITGSTRDSEFIVHEILKDITMNCKVLNVGVVQNLEGGLTIDYIDKDSNEEARFILGFTELGYWTYCNALKSQLNTF